MADDEHFKLNKSHMNVYDCLRTVSGGCVGVFLTPSIAVVGSRAGTSSAENNLFSATSQPSLLYHPNSAVFRVCSRLSDASKELLDPRAPTNSVLEHKQDETYSSKVLAVDDVLSHKLTKTNDHYFKWENYFLSGVPVYDIIVGKIGQHVARVIFGSLILYSDTEKSISANRAYPLKTVKKTSGRPPLDCY